MPIASRADDECGASGGADLSQFAPRAASTAGAAKGANTRAFQLSESGRLDFVPKASVVGLDTRPWSKLCKQATIKMTDACVSFNDSEMRQSAYMNLTKCDERGTCPWTK